MPPCSSICLPFSQKDVMRFCTGRNKKNPECEPALAFQVSVHVNGFCHKLTGFFPLLEHLLQVRKSVLGGTLHKRSLASTLTASVGVCRDAGEFLCICFTHKTSVGCRKNPVSWDTRHCTCYLMDFMREFKNKQKKKASVEHKQEIKILNWSPAAAASSLEPL